MIKPPLGIKTSLWCRIVSQWKTFIMFIGWNWAGFESTIASKYHQHINEIYSQIYKQFIGHLELFSSIKTLSETIIRNKQYHKSSSMFFFFFCDDNGQCFAPLYYFVMNVNAG